MTYQNVFLRPRNSWIYPIGTIKKSTKTGEPTDRFTPQTGGSRLTLPHCQRRPMFLMFNTPQPELIPRPSPMTHRIILDVSEGPCSTEVCEVSCPLSRPLAIHVQAQRTITTSVKSPKVRVVFHPTSTPTAVPQGIQSIQGIQGIQGTVFGAGMVYHRRQDCSEGTFMVPIGHLAVQSLPATWLVGSSLPYK